MPETKDYYEIKVRTLRAFMRLADFYRELANLQTEESIKNQYLDRVKKIVNEPIPPFWDNDNITRFSKSLEKLEMIIQQIDNYRQLMVICGQLANLHPHNPFYSIDRKIYEMERQKKIEEYFGLSPKFSLIKRAMLNTKLEIQKRELDSLKEKLLPDEEISLASKTADIWAAMNKRSTVAKLYKKLGWRAEAERNKRKEISADPLYDQENTEELNGLISRLTLFSDQENDDSESLDKRMALSLHTEIKLCEKMATLSIFPALIKTYFQNRKIIAEKLKLDQPDEKDVSLQETSVVELQEYIELMQLNTFLSNVTSKVVKNNPESLKQRMRLCLDAEIKGYVLLSKLSILSLQQKDAFMNEMRGVQEINVDAPVLNDVLAREKSLFMLMEGPLKVIKNELQKHLVEHFRLKEKFIGKQNEIEKKRQNELRQPEECSQTKFQKSNLSLRVP